MIVEQAKSADSLINTIGVNTHLHYADTVYNRFDDLVKPKLVELGVRHVRDGAMTYPGISRESFFYQRVRQLADAGIQFNFITSSLDTAWGDPTDYSLLDDIYDWSNGAISSFEGVNEPDLQQLESWVAGTTQGQEQLYNTVNSDPKLQNLSVIGPSVVHPENRTQLGDISPWMDYGNIHNYYAGRNPETTGWGSNGYGSIDWNFAQAQQVSGRRV